MVVRRTRWIDALLNNSVSNGGQVVVSLVGNLTPNESAEMTLVRTIMCYQLKASVPGGVNGSQLMDIGIGSTSLEAFSAGVIPDPPIATDFPLMGWVYRCRHVVVDSVDAHDDTPREVTKDIRSQRKISRGELYIAMNNTALDGTTFTVVVTGIIRCLFKMA